MVMAAKVISGKEISENIRKSLEVEVAELTEAGIKPGLAVILVGEDPASKTYVTSKQKSCRAIGMESILIELPEDTAEHILLEKIDELNHQTNIHGILVQLPLPEHISEEKV